VTVQEAIGALAAGRSLDAAALEAVIAAVLAQEATAAQVGALLMALHMKGETVDEIEGVARALRARATMLPGEYDTAVDTCGTGGDGASTFNVSTAAALVVAGAGVPVAKHGNRAVSGRVGSADVLETLGVRVDLEPAAAAACLRRVGIAFLYAPSFHPAMRAVSGPRRELGLRTVFNLVGPLVNPARVRRQVVGVAERRWLEPLALVLGRLGSRRAWVVHGADGLDELSLAGPSEVVDLKDGVVRRLTVRPDELGLETAPVRALQVESAEESAARIESVLAGAQGPSRDVTCLNAAAALVVGGAAADLAAGLVTARAAIDDGRAAATLERLRAFTNDRGGGAPS
jgi:anthranilate phosphoribosyltransferase